MGVLWNNMVSYYWKYIVSAKAQSEAPVGFLRKRLSQVIQPVLVDLENKHC